jgi:hypothetical protein
MRSWLSRAACAALVLLAAAACPAPAAARTGSGNAAAGDAAEKTTAVEEAQAALARAEELYKAGDYTGSEGVVDEAEAMLDGVRSAAARRTLARLRVLEALLAYTFRDEGYQAEVEEALESAVALDLGVSAGSPADTPPYILDRFEQVRAAYLARFSRTARRNTVGLVGAMVLEPTIFTDLSILQPGLLYSFNLNDRLTVEAELRIPLRLPVWDSLRGQVGLIWYPGFQVETVNFGLSTAYMFGLDELRAFTHSLSIGGQGEVVTRSGFGFGANVEMVRVDLLLGFAAGSELPSYRTIPFLANLLRLAFANIRMFAFWTF